MNPSPASTRVQAPALARSRLAQRLRRVLRGEVLFDAFSRGRYASDASPLHVEPIGVVVPADEADVLAAIDLAAELRVPVLPRGAGSGSGAGAIGEALVLDVSRALNRILAFDPSAGVVHVQPGVTLAQLDAFLRPHGLCFPVELPGASQATLGGVIASNACGLQAIAQGEAVHHVLGVDALLSDGTREFFGPFGARTTRPMGSARTGALVSRLFEIATRERDEILRAWPRVARRVGGLNLDAFHPVGGRPLTDDGAVNLGHLLAGSQGRLAHFLGLHLRVMPRPAHRLHVTVSCGSLGEALAAARALTGCAPRALLLLDPAGVDRARRVPALARCLGAPSAQAVLLLEFADEDPTALRRSLVRLSDALATASLRATVCACDPATAGPLDRLAAEGWRHVDPARSELGWIDACAVPTAQLCEFEAALAPVLARHGVRADWSGQVGLGAPRLRLIDLRRAEEDRARGERVRSVRHDIAVLAARLQGLCLADRFDAQARRASIALAFGDRLTSAFEEIEALFDPAGLMGGRVSTAARPRPTPTVGALPAFTPVLDWRSVDAGMPDGLPAAVGACAGEGDCRALSDGWMCPSFRATGSERDSPRGRANTLRLALAGALGADPLGAPAMAETFASCLGCKACRSECPSGVDIARMRIEVLHRQRSVRSRRLADRLFADFPRYAPWLSRAGWLVGLRDTVPGLRAITERWLGLARQRSLPRLRRDTFLRGHRAPAPGAKPREVVLFADCFGNHQAPGDLRAAVRVLEAAGWAVHAARPALTDPKPGRPLCCGRTYLACGDVAAARAEARRTAEALAPHLARGLDLIGLEPSCLLTMRDEFLALGLGDIATLLARRALLFEEFVAREHAAGRFPIRPGGVPWRRALVQPHCHQRAFDAVTPMRYALGLVPALEVEVLDAGCCGMGGDFGYRAEQYAMSMRIGQQGPLPALAGADADTVLVADGIGCRTQIADAVARPAMHLASVLDRALGGPPTR